MVVVDFLQQLRHGIYVKSNENYLLNYNVLCPVLIIKNTVITLIILIIIIKK